MKKLLIALIFSLVASVPTAMANVVSPFYDVYYGHPNYVAINYLRERAAIHGTQDGLFRPSERINRAEFVSMVVRAAYGMPEFDSYVNCFSDVRRHWFANEVCYAKSQGWLSGLKYSTNTFKPTKKITIAEAGDVMSKAFGRYPGSYYPPLNYRSSGSSSLTRADAAQMIYDNMTNNWPRQVGPVYNTTPTTYYYDTMPTYYYNSTTPIYDNAPPYTYDSSTHHTHVQPYNQVYNYLYPYYYVDPYYYTAPAITYPPQVPEGYPQPY